jgi:hypothetical protein
MSRREHKNSIQKHGVRTQLAGGGSTKGQPKESEMRHSCMIFVFVVDYFCFLRTSFLLLVYVCINITGKTQEPLGGAVVEREQEGLFGKGARAEQPPSCECVARVFIIQNFQNI